MTRAGTGLESLTLRPSVYVGASAQLLPRSAVLSVLVDAHLHLPDMFEITLADRQFTIAARSNITLGTPIEIWAGAKKSSGARRLIVGEVTSIEGIYEADIRRTTVVRGYTTDHRLQRVRRTRTFVNMTDSDIARKVATDAGLEIGQIDATKTTHDHVGQANQTDWDFLCRRASRVGYEAGVVGGKFCFRPASATSGRPGEPPVKLTFQHNLRTFLPRITCGNLSKEVEVRGWDTAAVTSIVAKAPIANGSAKLDDKNVDAAANAFGAATPKPAPPATNPALADLGPAPSEQAHVVSLPFAVTAAADEGVQGAVEDLGSTFAEAEGIAVSAPDLHAGSVVEISGVPAQFAGKYVVTRARHVFDQYTTVYSTHFEVSGRQERSLLGLATRGARQPSAPLINGLVCGVVSNVLDDQKQGRVKVTLPWLSPLYESDWAPVVQAGGGPRSGGMFLPEVGDQVLVGFELGDPQRPFVLGGVLSKNSVFPKVLGGEPTKSTNAAGDVIWRGFVTPSGNRLAFHDEMPPGQGKQPPMASDLVLGTKGGNLALAIDQVAGTVALTCDPKPPDSKTPQGKLTIECGNAGAIEIKTGPGGTVDIDGGAQLSLKAQAAVKIESQGVLELKGALVKIN